jgi:hypothetical protein
MKCTDCHTDKHGLLFRCGYAGSPKVGCRRLICPDCVKGYFLTGIVKRPLCKDCAPIFGGRSA